MSRPEVVLPSKAYSLLGIRWYGEGLFTKAVKVGPEIQARTLYQVRGGDLVYSRLFAWKGSFALADTRHNGSYVSNEFPTYEIDRDRLEPEFLRWYFKQQSVWTAALSKSTGGTPTSRNRLPEEAFLALLVPLPSLSEQRRMAARLGDLAASLEQARRLREASGREALALLSSQVQRLFSRLTCEWPTRSLGSLSPHVTSGPRNWAGHYQPGGHRFYRAQDIGSEGRVLQGTRVFVAPPPGEQGRTAMLRRGDLMIVITGATVGRCALFGEGLEPGFVSQHVAICRLPQDAIEPVFALWALRCPGGQTQLLGQRYGQGKPGLNLTNIRALSLPVPPISIQRSVVAELDTFQASLVPLRQLQSQTATDLDACMPAILMRAFRGEL